LAWLLLRFPPAVKAFNAITAGVNPVILFANDGSRFVFGNLGGSDGPWGFVFAFQVLPIIIFFASLMAILYHWGVMQRVIAALAWVLRTSLGVTGTESLSMAANVFVGQTEAPLCVRPYIAGMTRSQIAALMTGGFATIAGSVLAAYVGILGGDDEAARILYAKHLLTASVLSAPAALVIAKIMFPETESPADESIRSIRMERTTRNTLDAAAAGATDGLRLAVNVGAMLIAFVALLAMLNWPLAWLGERAWLQPILERHGVETLSIQVLLGWLFMPLAWTMGVPWEDCDAFGALLGEKLIATEFIAYLSLAREMHTDDPLISARAAQIATYALCGFANFPSIAIQIGGLTALAPTRRSDFATLGLRCMIGGALASWMTASIAGLFIV
ncbi:MAG: NupC/NupG family nucleoside CNT transporter, partial [Planctomycetota bacterium]